MKTYSFAMKRLTVVIISALLATAAGATARAPFADGPTSSREFEGRTGISSEARDRAVERTERPAPPVKEARPSEYKTTYLRESTGGVAVVQSNAGGSHVTRLLSDGTRQSGPTSTSLSHAAYVDNLQRTGAEVISKVQAERLITEINRGETDRQVRERQERERTGVGLGGYNPFSSLRNLQFLTPRF